MAQIEALASRNARIIADHVAGVRYAETAERLGISEEGVRKVVWKARRRGAFDAEAALAAQIVAAARDGRTAGRIARDWQVPQDHVVTVCAAAGVRLAAPRWPAKPGMAPAPGGPHPLEGRFAALVADGAGRGRPVATRFLHRRRDIPCRLRADNLAVLDRVIARAANDRARESLRALAHLWATCATTFAAFDVEPADAARAAAEAAHFRGGRYPRRPGVDCSAVGSPMAMCADLGSR